MKPLRCCLIPQDFACLLVGVITFIIAFALVVISAVVLVEEHKEEGYGAKRLSEQFHLILTQESLKIICAVVILVAILWMLFSIMLIVGIIKNRASFLLSYFGYGSVIVILLLLSGLLLLLTKEVHWITAVAHAISARNKDAGNEFHSFAVRMMNVEAKRFERTGVFYIYCLMSVHALYEEMQQGHYNRRNIDQMNEELIREFDDTS